ncbi:nucleotidyltransferase domain-containing protein [Thiocapsa rosea]|uniref:Putative nucleotidyltransferase-like protein n=1 Tax=Thiocapsa rosea TaxID=69360 RepID=A0A495VDK6_9GAMM|nr:nucleotidyltransferase family protein [Thiocapsa rosea]RKT47481.1 putative nucleotidyltransferase-like protein [Thiocapsa rosea]
MNLKDELLKTKEWALLLSCMQHASEAQLCDQKSELIRDIDWNYLFSFSEYHSLLPILHWGIKRMGDTEAPPEVLTFLRDNFRASHLRNLLAAHTLSQCEQMFKAERIPAIAFKGIVLAYAIYEHPALRQFGDIDILIQQHQLPKARSLLQQHDYRPVYPPGMLTDPRVQELSFNQTRIYDRYYHELTLQSRDDLMQIDLHWALSPRLYPSAPDLAGIWGGIRTASLNGHTVLTLSQEHQLLNICIHAAKDRWRTLKWVVDIDRLVRSEGDLDWVQLKELASASRSDRILTFGLHLSQLLLDTPIPTSRFASAKGRSSEADLSAILEVLFRPGTPRPRALGCLGINPIYLRLCGGWSLRMRYLCRALTLPRPEDEVMFGLAQQQYPLWRLRRPFWLLGRCLSRIPRPRPDANPFRE